MISWQKISKNWFIYTPKKCPFEKSLFRSKNIKFSHKCIDLNLKSNFAIIYLQNKLKRYDFRSKLTILCQFWVAIPDGSNLSIFDHTFEDPYEVLWYPKLKILILYCRRGLGLSKITFFFIISHLVVEQSLFEFS